MWCSRASQPVDKEDSLSSSTSGGLFALLDYVMLIAETEEDKLTEQPRIKHQCSFLRKTHTRTFSGRADEQYPGPSRLLGKCSLRSIGQYKNKNKLPELLGFPEIPTQAWRDERQRAPAWPSPRSPVLLPAQTRPGASVPVSLPKIAQV